MDFAILHVDPAGLTCLFFGFFLLAFGLYSRTIKDLYLSEPLLSTFFGIVLGPKCLGWLSFDAETWDEGFAEDSARETLAWFLRIVIGVQVLFAASTLPSRYLLQRPNMISMAVLLLPVMTLSWLLSSALVKLCLPSFSITEALIVGAALAPTDPVLANSVVKGMFAERHVPRHVRELLVAESGLNDGFGTPFIFVPLLAIAHNFQVGPTVKALILETMLWNVVIGALLGTGIGYAARKALKLARNKDTIDRESMLVFSVALALFTLGVGNLLHTNELLACFFAGTAVNWTDKIRQEDLYSHFSEGVELAFDSSVFLVIGALLPWGTWLDRNFLPPWSLVLLGVMIMLFRRLPAVLLTWRIIPQLKTWKEAIFVGHFGPISAGALYYALIATEELPDDYEGRNKIIATVTFIVLCSIIVHGTSAPLIMLASAVPTRFVSKISDLKALVSTDAPAPNHATTPTETSPLLRPLSNVAAEGLTRAQLDELLTDVDPDVEHVSARAYHAMGNPNTHRHRATMSDEEEAGAGAGYEARNASRGLRQDGATAADRRGGNFRFTVYDEGSNIVVCYSDF
ncbi:Sodium/hydrogen exchanger family-domain-containing protein [Mycena sp. CBHHK59/15]|nr:Sodium/hydrogen exchanger family-domain-containing protein [Mycena sp. CBHHK59/15]